MKIVRIIKDWNSEETLTRQTPNNSGIWDGIKFTFEEVDSCDYLIVWNRPPHDIQIECLPGGKWLISGEPPTDIHRLYLDSYQHFDIAFSQYDKSNAKKHIVTNGALPWHIGKSFDELIDLKPEIEKKLNFVSCISSNLNFLKGHRKRLNFIKFLKEKRFQFDLYGRDVNPIDDKFEAIFPYKYSIAIENSSYPHYWTEKIADCFLSWTMPIYYGCPNIRSYFPPESMIIIDVEKPNESLKLIQQAIAEDRWMKNLDAIEQSRNLVLNKYQFFPKMAEHIRGNDNVQTNKERYTIPKSLGFWEVKPSLTQRLVHRIKDYTGMSK